MTPVDIEIQVTSRSAIGPLKIPSKTSKLGNLHIFRPSLHRVSQIDNQLHNLIVISSFRQNERFEPMSYYGAFSPQAVIQLATASGVKLSTLR